MSSPTSNKHNSPNDKGKNKKHIKKWPDRDIIDAQLLFLQGNTPKQIEALIEMPERSVNRFIGHTPDDYRRSIEDNTKTSAWHDLCWEKALDQFSQIRNKDRANKGYPPLPRDKRERRSDPEVTGFDHPRNKAKEKAKADKKAKDKDKAKLKPISPPKTTSPPPRQSKSPTSFDGGGVGPVRTSPTMPRASAFGVAVPSAQASLKDQLAARRAKKEGAMGTSTSGSSGKNGFGTSSIRSTLGESRGGSLEMPAGLEAYSRLGLGEASSPLLGRSHLAGSPVGKGGVGADKENKARGK